MQLEVDGVPKGLSRLTDKPSARLTYSFIPGSKPASQNAQLLVFLGGIDSPRKVWRGVLAGLISQSGEAGLALPPMLTYDRFGVGESDHDPSDNGKSPNEYHDALASMRDLRGLITQIAVDRLCLADAKLQDLRIIFCAHSIGCCVARLYADAYPGSVEALLLIDSAIAGTAAEKLVPDPDIPDAWEKRKGSLPEGTMPDECRRAVSKARQSPFSGHAMTTKERIRWDNMPDLLPLGSKPRLIGPKPHLPLVTVLVCDGRVMIPQLAIALGMPEPLITNTWYRIGQEYSRDLVHLQGQGVGKGPITAEGCSHNIPRDGPGIVASELVELLSNLSRMRFSRI